jgi:hypothetical protein
VINSIRVDDFTGGLNLDANVFRLAKNQSGDLLNVDLNPKGGVSSRWGFSRINTSAAGGFAAGAFYPSRLFSWQGTTRYLMLASNDGVYHSTGGNFTSLSLTTNNEFGASFAPWDTVSTSLLYVARGAGYQMTKWNGTTTTNLTASGGAAGVTEWQDDLTSPTGTHAPKSEHTTTHVNRLWVAGTTEGASSYPNRVRFSHPLFPESWRQDDYIDIPAGGSKITAIVPFSGHLVVFKESSVWAIFGYSEDTFQLVELTRKIGAVSQCAVALGDNGVYFYSNNDGVFFYDGKGIKDLYENLRPLNIDSEVNDQAKDAISLGYANGRVYLSLPSGDDVVDIPTYDSSVEQYDSSTRKYDGGTRATRPTSMFVYDRAVGSGAWTFYKSADGFGLVTPIDFLTVSGETLHVAAHPYQPYILSIDKRENGSQDNITGTGVSFDSYYVAGWQDANNVAARKMWRRPQFVLRNEQTANNLSVDVYQDWDGFNDVKSFSIAVDATTVAQSNWQSWLEPDFGASPTSGDALGLARSVQLRFTNSSGPWAVYSIVYRFNPRKARI